MVLLLASSSWIFLPRILPDDLCTKRIIGVIQKIIAMKIRYKKRNSPRMQSAINRTFHAYTNDWFFRSNVKFLALVCLDLAYGADKYDVLNKLCCPYKRGIVSYVRCDIRHRSRFMDVLLLLLLLTFLWLISQPIVFTVAGINQTSDILLIG